MVARLAVIVTLLGLPGCGGGGAQGAFTPASMPQGGDWTGVYFSDWGRLELQRTGDTVVGTYNSDIKHGRISGTVNGNVLRFTWNQQDDRIIGHTREMSGAGQFQYVVDANGEHRLEGTWGYGADISGAGVWNANRSRSRVRPRVNPNENGTGGEGEGEGSGDSGGESGGDSGGEGEPASPDALDDL